MCLFSRNKAKGPVGPKPRIVNLRSAQSSSSLPSNLVSNPTPTIPSPDPLRRQTPASVTSHGSVASPTELEITPSQTPPALGDPGIENVTQTRWEQALARLSAEIREGVDLNSSIQDLNPLGILGLLLQETKNKKVECQDRQWKYKDARGKEVPVRDVMNTLLVSLNKYTPAVDLTVQPLSSVVSLVLGGFKILLQVAITDMENTAIAMQSLDSLARILGHCGVYEKLYAQKVFDSSPSLDDALIDLYVLILEYLCYLKRHLAHNTAVRGFQNIASGLKTRWELVLSMESVVDREAGVAQQEAFEKNMFDTNERMLEITAFLKDTSALQQPVLEIQSTVKNTKRTVENIFKSIQDDERLRILNWLSNVSHREHHTFNKSFRSPGTGGWLLDKQNFRSWNDSDSSALLWLHGIAGSGKTTLASRIIDDSEPKTNDHALAYFYCNYKEDQRKDPATIVRSLVKQLCTGSRAFPEPVLEIYDKRKNNADLANPFTLEECQSLLVRLSTGFLRTTIVIDALDECDRHTRGKLCDLLAHLVSSSSSKGNTIKVFVTSRDDGDLRASFENSPNIYIQERDNSTDINCYIQAEVKACIEKKRLLGGTASLELREQIIDALQAGAHGMFLWVKHLITKLCEEVTAEGVQIALTELPNDLNDVYTQILNTTRAHKSPRVSAMADRALKFVLYTFRPLTAEELIVAVAFPGSVGNLTLPVLLDVCGGLVVLDEGLRVVRFAHFSVQEFLLKQLLGEEAHAMIGDITLNCLLVPSLDSSLNVISDYATSNWPEHVRRSGARCDSQCKEFLTSSTPFLKWITKLIYSRTETAIAVRPGRFGAPSPLLVACWYRLVDMAEWLLLNGADPNSASDSGNTALHCCARRGHSDIIRLLLNHGADVQKVDRAGGTPLFSAAEGGHTKVVCMLLDAGMDGNHKNKAGGTALSRSGLYGHTGVMRMLLDAGVDANSQDNDGRTALFGAAVNGHTQAMRMLLDGGLDLNVKDRNGWTALFGAAANGHTEAMRLLLDGGLDANDKANDGRTALFGAAAKGYMEAMRMLLELGVDANHKAENGRTALFGAAANERTEVMQMLLNAGVEVNSKDKSGRTVLAWAVINGYIPVVQVLLGCPGLDIETKDNSGKTPLSLAVSYENTVVAQMLRKTGAASGEQTNNQSPVERI